MNETKQTTEVLGRAELFQGIADSTLEKIAGIADHREYDEGDALYQLGDTADDIYVLVQGRVRFTLGVGNRPESGHSIMTGRMVIGWAALVEDQPRRVATAVCLEPSTVIAVNGKQLLGILAEDPDAGFLVMRRLASMIARNFMT